MRYVTPSLGYLVSMLGSIPLAMLTLEGLLPPYDPVDFSFVAWWLIGFIAYLSGVGLFLKRRWGRIGSTFAIGGSLLLLAWRYLIDPLAREDPLGSMVAALILGTLVAALNSPAIRKTTTAMQKL